MSKRTIIAMLVAALATVAAVADEDLSFGENFLSLRGHRFVEVRGAIPVFPALTSHGAVQSFEAAFEDILSDGNVEADYIPGLATDLNLTIFPPIANYRLGFMLGMALDYWERTDVKDKSSKLALDDDTVSYNFYYVGFHADYGHWVMSDIGTRISIYGELAVGWLVREDDYDTEHTPWLDICPLGVQFCPEKHVGIYLEFPHFGARPFVQVGVSLGI